MSVRSVLVEDGHIRVETFGRTLYVHTSYDPDVLADIRDHFDKYYTIRFENCKRLNKCHSGPRVPTADHPV